MHGPTTGQLAALALALLCLASVAAQDNCTAQFGPGCTACGAPAAPAAVTVGGGGRKLLQPLFIAQHAGGERRRGGGGQAPPNGTYEGHGHDGGQQFPPNGTYEGRDGGQQFPPNGTYEGRDGGQQFPPNGTYEGRDGGQQFPPNGTYESHGYDGAQRHNDTNESGANATQLLTCMACDPVGYVLTTETHDGLTYGRCECNFAAGWGVLPLNASAAIPTMGHRRHGTFACVDCGATGQVPLTGNSSLTLTYANGTWSLVLTAPGANSTLPWSWAFMPGRRRRHAAAESLPPYFPGQCVSCPDGSAPDAGNVTCVATARR